MCPYQWHFFSITRFVWTSNTTTKLHVINAVICLIFYTDEKFLFTFHSKSTFLPISPVVFVVVYNKANANDNLPSLFNSTGTSPILFHCGIQAPRFHAEMPGNSIEVLTIKVKKWAYDIRVKVCMVWFGSLLSMHGRITWYINNGWYLIKHTTGAVQLHFRMFCSCCWCCFLKT